MRRDGGAEQGADGMNISTLVQCAGRQIKQSGTRYGDAVVARTALCQPACGMPDILAARADRLTVGGHRQAQAVADGLQQIAFEVAQRRPTGSARRHGLQQPVQGVVNGGMRVLARRQAQHQLIGIETAPQAVAGQFEACGDFDAGEGLQLAAPGPGQLQRHQRFQQTLPTASGTARAARDETDEAVFARERFPQIAGIAPGTAMQYECRRKLVQHLYLRSCTLTSSSIQLARTLTQRRSSTRRPNCWSRSRRAVWLTFFSICPCRPMTMALWLSLATQMQA